MIKWMILAVALSVAGATAAENLTSARKELASTGKLRVGILVGSLGPSTFYTMSDPTVGGLRGVTVDLAAALARELGVPLELVPYPSAEALNQSATAGAWDVTFMTVDHHRQTLVDFGPAYVTFEATYLVPSASPIQSIADVDRPGIRVFSNPPRRIGAPLGPITEERKAGSHAHARGSLREVAAGGSRCHCFPTWAAERSCQSASWHTRV